MAGGRIPSGPTGIHTLYPILPSEGNKIIPSQRPKRQRGEPSPRNIFSFWEQLGANCCNHPFRHRGCQAKRSFCWMGHFGTFWDTCNCGSGAIFDASDSPIACFATDRFTVHYCTPQRAMCDTFGSPRSQTIFFLDATFRDILRHSKPKLCRSAARHKEDSAAEWQT